MDGYRSGFVLTLFALILFFSALCHSQPPHNDSHSTGTRIVHLAPIKSFRKGVDLWPLIATPDRKAEQQINKLLTEMNAELADQVRECDLFYRESIQVSEQRAATKRDNQSDWERKVRVTMRGPSFLSLVARESFYCGGVHPDSAAYALVFDLRTGDRGDLKSMVREGDLYASLTQMTREAASDECKEVFDEKPDSFLIWPDAEQNILVARADNLPHVIQGCAEELHIGREMARKLGFDENLFDDIQAAHAAFIARS